MDVLTQPSKTDILFKVISLTSGLLIYLGLLKGTMFYYFFDVNILEYISLSEAIIFSINDFILFLVTSVLVFVILEEAYAPIRHKRKIAEENISDEEYKESYKKRVKRVGKVIYTVVWAYWLIVLVYIYFSSIMYKWVYISCFTIFPVSIMLSLEFIKRGKGPQDTLGLNTRLFIVIWYMLSVIMVVYGIINAEELKTKKPEYKSKIVLKEGKIINTTDSLIYVGRTEKYIFLYDKIVKAPEIISEDEIILIKREMNN